MSSIFSKRSEKGENYVKGKYGVDVSPSPSLSYDEECLFSIYDKVCEEYNPPFVSKNINTAIRTIKENLKGQQSVIAMHPEDYVLVHIGTFSKSTGTVADIDGVSYEISLLFVDKDKEKEVVDGVQK